MERETSPIQPVEELEASAIVSVESAIETAPDQEHEIQIEARSMTEEVRHEVRHQVSQVSAGRSASEDSHQHVRAIQRELKEQTLHFEAQRTAIATQLWPGLSQAETARARHNSAQVYFRSIADLRRTLAVFEQQKASELLEAADTAMLMSVMVRDFAVGNTESELVDTYFGAWGYARMPRSRKQQMRDFAVRVLQVGTPSGHVGKVIRRVSSNWHRGKVTPEDERDFLTRIMVDFTHDSLLGRNLSASGDDSVPVLTLYLLLNARNKGTEVSEQFAAYLQDLASSVEDRESLLEEEAHFRWVQDSLQKVAEDATHWIKEQPLSRRDSICVPALA